jgi:hypothetical protein
MARYLDGGGNLIASDGRAYPRVRIRFGPDIHWRNAWSLEVFWKLRRDLPGEGEVAYRREWRRRLSFEYSGWWK